MTGQNLANRIQKKKVEKYSTNLVNHILLAFLLTYLIESKKKFHSHPT